MLQTLEKGDSINTSANRMLMLTGQVTRMDSQDARKVAQVTSTNMDICIPGIHLNGASQDCQADLRKAKKITLSQQRLTMSTTSINIVIPMHAILFKGYNMD
jgi:hypothetical protein